MELLTSTIMQSKRRRISSKISSTAKAKKEKFLSKNISTQVSMVENSTHDENTECSRSSSAIQNNGGKKDFQLFTTQDTSLPSTQTSLADITSTENRIPHRHTTISAEQEIPPAQPVTTDSMEVQSQLIMTEQKMNLHPENLQMSQMNKEVTSSFYLSGVQLPSPGQISCAGPLYPLKEMKIVSVGEENQNSNPGRKLNLVTQEKTTEILTTTTDNADIDTEHAGTSDPSLVDEFWKDMDSILDEVTIDIEPPQETNDINYKFVKGQAEDLPENFVNQLKAIVPTTYPGGKKGYNIYFMKDTTGEASNKPALKEVRDISMAGSFRRNGPPDQNHERKLKQYKAEQEAALLHSNKAKSTPFNRNSKFDRGIYHLKLANEIASNNLYDTGGNTIQHVHSGNDLENSSS